MSAKNNPPCLERQGGLRMRFEGEDSPSLRKPWFKVEPPQVRARVQVPPQVRARVPPQARARVQVRAQVPLQARVQVRARVRLRAQDDGGFHGYRAGGRGRGVPCRDARQDVGVEVEPPGNPCREPVRVVSERVVPGLLPGAWLLTRWPGDRRVSGPTQGR